MDAEIYPKSSQTSMGMLNTKFKMVVTRGHREDEPWVEEWDIQGTATVSAVFYFKKYLKQIWQNVEVCKIWVMGTQLFLY